jgi:hypothetical protein
VDWEKFMRTLLSLAAAAFVLATLSVSMPSANAAMRDHMIKHHKKHHRHHMMMHHMMMH